MVSATKVKQRMRFVKENADFLEAIRQNLIPTKGYHEGNPCPCTDCNGTLRKKRAGYVEVINNKMVSIEFDVYFCNACGYQGRNIEEVQT